MFGPEFLPRFLIFLLLHSTLMGGLYLLALRRRNYAVVDAGWSAGVGLGGLVLMSDWTLRSVALLSLLWLWSGRLTFYLLRDRVFSHHVDKRYANMERALGPRARFGFLLLFLAQVPLAGLFLIPWHMAQQASQPLRAVDLLGIGLALAAIAGETLADRQLAAYRRRPQPKPRVFREGLWRYTRHPNYFFEWLHWCAYPLLALGASGWALSLLAPVLMYIFLFFITGIPHLEREALRSRGDAYRNYQLTTNRFWPWIPRNPA